MTDRIDKICYCAEVLGVSFDVIWALSKDLDDKAFSVFCGSAASMPRYMKSIVNPSLSHIASA